MAIASRSGVDAARERGKKEMNSFQAAVGEGSEELAQSCWVARVLPFAHGCRGVSPRSPHERWFVGRCETGRGRHSNHTHNSPWMGCACGREMWASLPRFFFCFSPSRPLPLCLFVPFLPAALASLPGFAER
ncbi:uncharacterized protein Tco025E_00016 [Trypanosoma conorhini]|uniref:Uncharacterized protein n=1 Tax=Trypanosoma conorhini TaxID=83891 RepID=A0A422QCB9_9TRYP|nr:uncharacterized protein Tco025E_00016 [Trypanosoma conorhini]RNF27632.1 hypothetical protein Tco025E_00016 [Trypanosoma conorhini]